MLSIVVLAGELLAEKALLLLLGSLLATAILLGILGALNCRPNWRAIRRGAFAGALLAIALFVLYMLPLFRPHF